MEPQWEIAKPKVLQFDNSKGIKGAANCILVDQVLVQPEILQETR